MAPNDWFGQALVSTVQQQALEPANLSDAAKRRRRFTDPERHAGLGGSVTSPHDGHQPRRIDEREPASFDSDGYWASRDCFTDMCPEDLGAGHVELAHNDDDGTGEVVLRFDVRTSLGRGFYAVQHICPPDRDTHWCGAEVSRTDLQLAADVPATVIASLSH
jgi:hypothetical protein